MLKLSRLIYIQICTKMPFGGSALLITIFAITGTINGKENISSLVKNDSQKAFLFFLLNYRICQYLILI